MSLEDKIEKLTVKKQKIETELQALQQKRTEEICTGIRKIDLRDWDTYTLMGALLAALETKEAHQKEVWRHAGKKFCTSKRPRTPRPKP